ncbi:uncharacterized protein A1O9_00117 [Exophiala aquamarina CBS 119918]|uniref:DNA replication checkpoint mediator MRC1 domain-containing protein n=1 Tax=Exophiala aquamarina CBS 119918 TaxID=1182545 RepID=A0A072Q2L2_9EURO|nr:uncharacterized protein A1O9_00117 [Exophiala aquamarina CBS 119918]KEF62145.1 hypothetical protein A1O9_00117 [Exophiala aquamarina CBS 119918]
MSLHSSPSPPSTPNSSHSQASDVLTPSRKVQALLARFDDSDSDLSPPDIPNTNAKPSHVQQNPPILPVDDDPEEEDSLQGVPRSRIAARLQGIDSNGHGPLRNGNDETVKQAGNATSSSESDELIENPAMRRRLLTKRKSSPVPSTEVHARSVSPLFFPSRSATLQDAPNRAMDDSDAGQSEPGTGQSTSKFLALVQKHRKQRLEKEAEEVAKQAARAQKVQGVQKKSRLQRGSSPADDSDEDSEPSELERGKKLSTQARPARKASKKALEEMNRETQRMSRNMQLAHQARTKKKISKESLLARFNFPKPNSSIVSKGFGVQRPSTSSSITGSDTERNSTHETPPTSPMQGDLPDATSKEPALGMTSALGQHTGGHIKSLDKGKGRAISEELLQEQVSVLNVHSLSGPNPISKPTLKQTLKQRHLELKFARAMDAEDSDSDLEVVTSKGDKRKYAAFEQLPKRKAKEAPSHIALRSLANLMGAADRKHSMNAAEMEASLRKAARLQARQERQQRIDELKAKGVVIQTTEEREREEQEVEDILERARQAATDIQKRELAQAKKDGVYTKDYLDDDDDDDESVQSADFEDEEDLEVSGDSEEEQDDDDDDDDDDEEVQEAGNSLVNAEAHESASEGPSSQEDEPEDQEHPDLDTTDDLASTLQNRKSRVNRVLSDDEEDQGLIDTLRSPQLPPPAKTPQSLLRSGRKQIPGLQMSDDLPIGLTQAFAATMADSQSQDMAESQRQNSLAMTMDLPSPSITMIPHLQRLDSIDIITDSQPASQTQPLNLDLSFSESQLVPQSPAVTLGFAGTQYTPSQAQFEPTQDRGYVMTPFAGNRFSTETPQHAPSYSTLDTLILPADVENSPILQRKSRLRRGRTNLDDSEDEDEGLDKSAFDLMRQAAKRKPVEAFDKAKSHAKNVVDEAAEESEDEYAGLGGASDEDVNEEENDHDREMIDEDTQVGIGDEAKLARLYADREREQDEAAVSKLMKDITTGALRRKRNHDDLDISDEEDAAVRRREAKRREFAKMRRELLKDEAVGKIAEDKKKEAFLRSIEDRDLSDDDGDLDQPDTPLEEESQEKDSRQQADYEPGVHEGVGDGLSQAHLADPKEPLSIAAPSKLNQARSSLGRFVKPSSQRPATLAEIRESVSILIDEPDSQSGTIDLGLSDSDDESEAYVNLDRHLQMAEADENAKEGGDLGDFIVDDDQQSPEEMAFKKPTAPYSESRAPFSERRTKERPNIINRLSMLRQSSSSSSSSSSAKMAFYGSNSSASASFGKMPSLLRRATTNSSLGSLSGKNENVSATGVVTNRKERGNANEEKEFVRKGNGGRRNAVNYRPTMREEKMSQRAGIAKKAASKGKKASGLLGGLLKQDSWA